MRGNPLHRIGVWGGVFLRAFLLSLTLAALALVSTSAQAPTPPRPLVIVGGSIITSPEARPISNGVVVVQGGRISAVGTRGQVQLPSGAEILEASGLTLTAGFWNSHVHFIEPKWAGVATAPPDRLTRQLTEMLTRYGVTTVVDTGSPWAEVSALRRRVASGEIDGPKILSVGEILSVRGGLTPPVLQRLGLLPGTAIEITSREQGVEQVRSHTRKGVDAIKIYAATTMQTDVEMPPDTLAAIVTTAHQSGKLALAHPHTLRGLQNAIAGRVDVVVHTIPNAGPLTNASVTAMTSNRMSLIPTLKLWAVEAAKEGAPPAIAERFVNVAVGQLRAFAGAKGQVLFGTDAGYLNDYDPSEEYQLMGRAGMGFRDILASLTTAPASRFGMSAQTGRIAVGMDADLVAVVGDPEKDMSVLNRIAFTVRQGRVAYRANR